jgi:acyl-CoA synthetase (AMP-forming)/AMP-acid ligase II
MPATIAGHLQRRAQEQPEAAAFHFIGNPDAPAAAITYAELDAAARSIAGLLTARGAAGQSVLLVYPSGLPFIAALFGCFYAGAIAVPVPVPVPSRAFERAPAIAEDARPALGLTLASIATDLDDADAAVRAIPWISTDERTGGDGPAGAPEPDAVALLQYSSGTTGRPRGVALSHANLLHNLAAMVQAVSPQAGDRAVSWLPMYHDMGLMGFVLFPVFAGFPATLMSPLTFLKRPIRWLQAVSTWRATLSAAPCFAYQLCLQRSRPEERAALDLSNWRIAVCGGEVVRPAVLEQFAGAFAAAGFRPQALAPAYGLAEATLLACSVAAGQGLQLLAADAPALAAGRLEPPRDAARTRRLAVCGQVWPGHHIAIVDPDRRVRLAEGRVGEIWLRGGSVAQGYWRQPLASEETFRAVLPEDVDPTETWLRTGDLGALGPGGLVVTGRRKDLIIVRGVNYDPLDIETAAAAADPCFIEGAGGAFSIETEAGEAVVLLQEVSRPAANGFDGDAAISAVAAALTRGFGLTLHDLALLRPGTLPRTTSGKVQRHLCRQRYLAGEMSRLDAGAHPAVARARPVPLW